MGSSRADFRWLAKTRIREAKALLDAGLFDGAYYLAGYAIECTLKACIVKAIRRSELPDRRITNGIYTHNLESLLGLAGLQLEYTQRAKAETQFKKSWNLVKDWSEEARYETFGSRTLASLRPPFKSAGRSPRAEQRARELYSAITDRQYGVLSWLKRFW
jgi:hypothetical protein